MGISTNTAKDLASLGASLEITAEAGYSTNAVKDIISIAVRRGGHLYIHVSSYSSSALKDFVRIGKGNVTIII